MIRPSTFGTAAALRKIKRFPLSNSRSLKQKETEKLHLQLGRDIAQAAKESGKTCTVISRGDSTLRGHYPLETQCLKQAMEEISGYLLL